MLAICQILILFLTAAHVLPRDENELLTQHWLRHTVVLFGPQSMDDSYCWKEFGGAAHVNDLGRCLDALQVAGQLELADAFIKAEEDKYK